MATSWGITFDCHDARKQASFWEVALGYVDAPPPTGWDSWQDWARHFEVPEEELEDGASLVDPDGVLPPIGFLKVPEDKGPRTGCTSTFGCPGAGTSTSP